MYAIATLDSRHLKRTTTSLLAALVACLVAAILVPAGAQAKVHVTPKPIKPRPAARASSWMPHIGRTIVPTRVNQLGSQLATWYGPGFFGHGTACGGTLTPSTIGVANKTLPCGTRITIRYHGRTVVAPVIDRGPYVSGRDYDLTEAVRNKLGFGGVGTVWTNH